MIHERMFTSEAEARAHVEAFNGITLAHKGRAMVAQRYDAKGEPKAPEEWVVYEFESKEPTQ